MGIANPSAPERQAPAWLRSFAHDAQAVFVVQWSPYVGALVLVVVNLALMAGGQFWGVFSGIRLWGDHFNNLIGLGPILGISPTLESPLWHRVSLMDAALMLGALSAALLSRQFGVKRAPRLEYVFGALGGTLMGIGALFAGGCTTGGFFTPLLFSSPVGWAMLVGLLAGSAVGLRILLWSMENISWGMAAPPAGGEPWARRHHPWLGALVAGLVLAWAAAWMLDGDARLHARAVAVAGGFAIGFVLVRSRLCFSRVVREPLMTGEGDMTKAFMLAIAIGAPVAALLAAKGVVDPYVAIPPRFWLGSTIGGAIFGVGMILAGGCASGSLWRMGEGHVKLWVALFFFAWSGSTFGALIGRTGIFEAEMNLDLVEESALGIEAYWPALTGGWGTTWLVTFALLGLWYALVSYNESSGRFTVT